MSRFKLSIVAVLCAVLAVPALAQTSQTTGEIRGKVTDSSRSTLPGVTVTATNQNTGLSRVGYTGVDGNFIVALLPPGTYRVTAQLVGLGQETRENVTVRLGATTDVSLSLNPQLSEEIIVTAEAPVVDTSESDVTYSVSEEQIQNLPILGRDFKDLVSLTPGVTDAFGGRVSLNGGRGIATDFNIDGAEANSDFFGEERGGTEAPFVFSQAAIQEMQVIRSTYSAEYNRGVGGTVNAITKSGTNDIGGQLFYYKRDASWADERETTINGQNVVDFFDARDVDQYGVAVGGPIMTDILHYFLTADFQDINEQITANDFRLSSSFQNLDPATQSALTSRINDLLGGTLDDQFQYPSDDDQETYLAKLDANIGSDHHFSLRHNYADYNNFPSESPRMLSSQGDEFNTVNSTVLELDSVLTDSIFNQLIVQYGVEERPINALEMDLPETRIDLGPTDIIFGRGEFLPNRTDEKKLQIKEKASWLLGNHYFKGGIEYLTTDIFNLFPRENAGQYFFDSAEDFLANNPSRLDQGSGPTDGLTEFDYGAWGAFIQDSWTYNDNLTLDFGLRYDLQDIPEPARNAFPEFPEFVDNFENDDDNLAPRFGFAYDLRADGRSVIRGGVGKYFTPIPSILYAAPLAEISGNYNRIVLICSRNPCPSYPNILSDAEFAQFVRSASDLTLVSPELENQESTRMSLGYEQQLGRLYSVSIEGVYADLTNQQRLVNINAVPTGIVYGNLPAYAAFAGQSGAAYPAFRDIKMHVSDAEGTYESITLATRKYATSDSRFSWLAHYTWSEAIDQDSNERSTSSSRSYDPFNPELSEGRADYNIEHRVVLSGTYELPFGINLSGIYRWNSGSPYTAEINAGSSGINGLFQVGVNTPVFVDRDGAIIDLTQANGSTREELAAFLAERGATIMERNSFEQPNFSALDIRLSKEFRIWNDLGIELIGEVFNALNEENTFVSFTNQRYFSGFFSNSSGWNFTRNQNFGRENSFTGQPRQYQAAVRLIF